MQYLDTGRYLGSAGSTPLNIRATRKLPLPGDGLVNAYGNVYPIDVDGDGRYEYLHFNGFRVARVVDASGRMLWQAENRSGRVHRSMVHRDTASVWDLDGDRRQEVIQCWANPGERTQRLVVRNGATGKVIRSVALSNPSKEECQLGTFFFAGRSDPLILVSHKSQGNQCKGKNFVDYLASVKAYDRNLNLVWQQSTCGAGHYFWSLDENDDGYAEGVYAGKYLLRANGSIACTLNIGGDHVDSAAIGDVSLAWPGKEIAIVGTTGVRLFTASSCAPRWSMSSKVLADPQNITMARLDPAQKMPLLLVRQRASQPQRKIVYMDGNGRVLDSEGWRKSGIDGLVQTANLDGATGRDEVIVQQGAVLGKDGIARARTNWLPAASGGSHPFDRWSPVPFAFDIDKDGKDEIVTWGRNAIVIGEAG